MAKYDYDFKKKVVNAYVNEERGYAYLAKEYGIPSESEVRLWAANYNAFADDGLKRSRKNTKYSFEKKLSVIESYLSSEISYQELAIKDVGLSMMHYSYEE